MNKLTFKLGVLGDSISVAHNAEALGSNESHSWATGLGGSHLTRIQRLFPDLAVKSFNMAVTGAKSSDLKLQVDQLLKLRPDYVTLMIGANDLSAWFMARQTHRISEFKANVQDAIERLIAVNSQIMILLVAIPDQSRALSLLSKQHLAGPYQSILANLMNHPELQIMKDSYKELQKKANDALKDLALAFSKNVRYAGSVATAAFSDAHLSRHDFYHPSVLGQNLLAELTWQEGFFPS